MFKIITPPQSEPVTLAAAKDHLRFDGNEQDTTIQALITAAREHSERYLGHAIGEQTIELSMQWFPQSIELPRPPIQSITSIKYEDADGTTQTLDASEYHLADYVVVSTNGNWPATAHYPDSVRVEYVAGYSVCPEPIKQAMLLMVGRMFDRHAEDYDDTLARVSDMLLWPYRSIAV